MNTALHQSALGVRTCNFEAVRSSERENGLQKRVFREKLTLEVSGGTQQRKQRPHGHNSHAWLKPGS